MLKKIFLVVIIVVFLIATIFLLFKYKPIKSDIVYFNEVELGQYIESHSLKDQLIMLNKDKDVYEIGYLKIPNFGFKKYNPIIIIKKKDIEIKNIEKIKINQVFYNDTCHKLMVFKGYKPKDSERLNYKNNNYSNKDKESCKNLLSKKIFRQ